MKVLIFDDSKSLARAAAAVFANEILSKKAPVLGLATGSTPLETYGELVKLYQDGVLSFREVRTFNLDEYVGLPREHPESYHSFMEKNLFGRVDLPAEAHHVPEASASDLEAETARYDALIEAAGGIDLQLLGLGQNGHIGFNEPAETFSSGTNVVQLTESTVEANSRFFASKDEVPRAAVSMGTLSIMKARKILLLATGEAKAEAVRRMVEGPMDPRCPASILQAHPDVLVFLDRGAAKALSR